jgi:ribulose-5-phosphate 4-epimerase/fuculose-1-phosphate aldolase
MSPSVPGGRSRILVTVGHAAFTPSSHEPSFDDVDAARSHRQQRLVLAYRLFGAMHWGEQGDGHISARDPGRSDAMWLLRYGIPFARAELDDLVLVGPDGSILEGDGEINPTAYYIHAPIHEARPDIVCAAHTHTAYGTPWSACAEAFSMICQEAVAFHDDQALFDDGEVDVQGTDGGKRIAAALGGAKLAILRNHGLLTVGSNVDEAVGWFLMAERVSAVHCKAPRPQPISDVDAARCAAVIGHPRQGWKTFNWAVRARLPNA